MFNVLCEEKVPIFVLFEEWRNVKNCTFYRYLHFFQANHLSNQNLKNWRNRPSIEQKFHFLGCKITPIFLFFIVKLC